MTATFVILGNVGDVTVVLRPSSDIKMMEDSTAEEISPSPLVAYAAHGGAATPIASRISSLLPSRSLAAPNREDRNGFDIPNENVRHVISSHFECQV